MEKANATTSATSGIGRSVGSSEQAHASGTYEVTCYDQDGNVRWVEQIQNLVTTAGKNDALDKYLGGAGYTATWYLGLVNGASPTFAAGDTAASHAGWTENTAYINATRPAPTFGAASAGTKATTATTFNMNADGQTISGCFLISNSTKGGTTGVLYSCGGFAGGNKSVGNGDILNVTYSASL